MNMKNQFGTNDLKVIIAYLYIDMAHRKENPSDRDKEISPVPPCRTPGGNQERSRKKGSIIKLSDNYNFVELFPQLKILLAQQMIALQSTAPGTPFIYTEHVKSQNQKSNRRELHTVEQRLEACQTLTHRKEVVGHERADFCQSVVQ